MAEYTVNEILEKLSKIEETAADIMEAASNDKKAVNAEYAEKKAEFDRELAGRYNGLSDEADRKNEAEANARIEEIDREAKKSMDAMEQKYNSEKDRMTKEIFDRIIEVG